MSAFVPAPDLPTLPEISRALVERPRAFSDCKEIPGARVYTQADNPQSRDGNHAYILKSDDFTQVIVDAVTWIYQDLDIVPRVWSAGPAREQQEVAHVLSQSGYKIIPASRKIRHLVRPEAISLPGMAGLDIRLVTPGDPGLDAIFAGIAGDLECLRNALRRNLPETGPGSRTQVPGTTPGQGLAPAAPASATVPVPSAPFPSSTGPAAPAMRLFGAWKEGRLVSVASLSFCRGLYWLDHLRTARGEEGKGYCQALLSTILNDPAISAAGRQVTGTDNPAVMHICQKLGYRALEDANPFWEAVLEGTHRSREPEDLEEGDEDGGPGAGGVQGSRQGGSHRPGAGRGKSEHKRSTGRKGRP